MTIADVRQEKSTTVRTENLPPPAVRRAFAVLNRIAPPLAARQAERLWFTLPPRRTPPPAPPDAFTVDLRGRTIAGWTRGAGPVVYVVHGWAGHSGQFKAFVDPLVARGFRVVAFDALSHGRSDPGAFGPRSTTILEIAASLTAVGWAYGPAHAVIAHSMGAAATALAVRDGLTAGRIAMLAPVADPRPITRTFADGLGMNEALYQRMVRRIERRVGMPMNYFDIPALGRTAAMPPTLVVDDRDDNSTAGASGRSIAAAWPSASLRVTSGLGHYGVLRDPQVVGEVLDFVA